MNVAVRSSQHLPTFGQCASSQTECRFHCRSKPFRRRKLGPPGARTLSQGGLGESVARGVSRRGRETPIRIVFSPSAPSLWHSRHEPAHGATAPRAALTSRAVGEGVPAGKGGGGGGGPN